jgi:hypothetical protein
MNATQSFRLAKRLKDLLHVSGFLTRQRHTSLAITCGWGVSKLRLKMADRTSMYGWELLYFPSTYYVLVHTDINEDLPILTSQEECRCITHTCMEDLADVLDTGWNTKVSGQLAS